MSEFHTACEVFYNDMLYFSSEMSKDLGVTCRTFILTGKASGCEGEIQASLLSPPPTLKGVIYAETVRKKVIGTCSTW